MDLELSEKDEVMLNYDSSDHKSESRIQDTCEDVENNNNNNNDKDEKRIFCSEKVNVTYSSNSKGVLAQCLVTGAVFLIATGGGMPIGYSAVMLPQLLDNNSSTIYVDRELGSWIASVHSLATPIGALLSGPLLDIIGRRGSLQLTTIPLCIGWLIIGFSTNIHLILLGRIICGVSIGLQAVPAQVLMGETADPALRGIMLVGGFAAYCFGILLVYGLGASFSWDIVAFCGIVLPILGLIALCLVPESPAWLVRRKKIDKAKKALLWLRGGDIEQVNVEISILKERVKDDLVPKYVQEKPSLRERISSTISIICNRGVVKPLIIINLFNALQVGSGTYIIVFYAVYIIKDIGNSNVDNYLAAVVTGVIRFIFSVVACVFLLRMGRRTLGMLSAFGTALASLLLAGCMIAKKEDFSVDSYIIALCLLFYVAANTVGLLVLPGLMIGELLPLRARGIGGGCTFFMFNLILFFVTKYFPSINEAVGIIGVFIIFGVSAFLEGIFLYIALPETKNRTLQEIEDYFQQSNILWVTRTRVKKRNTIITDNA